MNRTKTKAIAITLLVSMLVAFGVCGCEDSSFGRSINNIFNDSDVKYEATTRFLYSQDGGTSWSETIQELPVNETYYLAIEMQVAQSEETRDEQSVQATVTIPSTNVLDCYLDDHPGKSITGLTDDVNKCVIYNFNIVAGTSPTKFRVVFECMPLETGRATFQVEYDDKVSDNWDATGTIKYVAANSATADDAITTTTTTSTTKEDDD